MSTSVWKRVVGVAVMLTLGMTVRAQVVAPPEGDVAARNLDQAAVEAFSSWIAQLSTAPNMEGVRNIGILPLARDTDGFTEILAAQLSAQPGFRVVVLRGGIWNAIEDELARTDPNDGLGDIMDKATIKWQEVRGEYNLPETASGADALVVGRVRGVDRDWLRARTRFVLEMARVDTRTMVAGGIVEGESQLGMRDIVIYYKSEILWGVVILIGVLIVLGMFRRFIKATERVR